MNNPGPLLKSMKNLYFSLSLFSFQKSRGYNNTLILISVFLFSSFMVHAQDSVSVGLNGGGSQNAPCTQILRFDHYKDEVASAPGGQNLQWVLQNGNILTMNVWDSTGNMVPHTPTVSSVTAFGNTGYTGLTGHTILYQTAWGAFTSLVFSNIQLRTPSGQVVPNFSIVAIDAESTINSEGQNWITNGPDWYQYDSIAAPGSSNWPTIIGVGTNNVKWTGNGPSNAGAHAIYANAPSQIRFYTKGLGTQGIALGIASPVQSSNVALAVCSDAGFNATPVVFENGTKYSWSSPVISPAGSITGGSAQTNVTGVSQTLVNTTTSPATATYTVTASVNDLLSSGNPNLRPVCGGQVFKVTVTVYPSATFTTTATPVNCASGVGGSIALSHVSGAASPYTVSWTGPNNYTGTGTSIYTLSPGIYSYTLTDAHGCTTSGSDTIIKVGSLTHPTVTSTNVNCSTTVGGSIALSHIVGAGPFNVSWTGSNNYISNYTASGNNIYNLKPGYYSYTITDAHGCTTTGLDTITTAGSLRTVTITSTPVNCNTPMGGSLVLSNILAGNPFVVIWRGPDNFLDTAINLYDIGQGAYSFTMIDSFDCTTSGSGTVGETGSLSLSLYATNASDSCTDNGAISIHPHIPSNSVFQWSGPNGYTSTAGNISNLSPGVYTVTAATTYGCSIVLSDTVKALSDKSCTNSLRGPIVLKETAMAEGGYNFTLENLYPNPARQQVSVAVISNVNTTAIITLTDMFGRPVLKEYLPLSTGSNTYQFDVGKYTEGAYTVTVSSDNIKSSKRLVVSK
jgi:hypothetical protein